MTTHDRFISRLLFMLLLVSPSLAFAQDKSKIGMVAMAPTALAVQFNVTPSIAVRPEFSFTQSHSEAGTTTTSSLTTNPGVAALIYLKKVDAVQTYVSPRYVFQHAHSRTVTTVGTSESSGNAHTFSGALGAEYAAHAHVSMFGEVGLNFTHTSSGPAGVPATSTGRSWAVRSAVGAILFF